MARINGNEILFSSNINICDKLRQEKTVEITQNGPTVITADEGYELSKVTANVHVEKPTQAKAVDITENGTTEIVADEGYALSKVTANVNVKGTINKIKQRANRSLTELTAEDLEGVTRIEEYAFNYCYSLRTVTIPESVQDMHSSNGCFYCCYSLAEVINKSALNIKKGNSDNGYVAYYALTVHQDDSSRIVNTDGLATLIADDGQNYCLGYDGTNTEIILPENCNVNQYAFYKKNINLKSITISNGATSIGKYAFWLCPYITKITLPNSLTSIGNQAFTACHCLEELRIPEGITTLNSIICQGTGYASKTGEFNLYLPSTITSVATPIFFTSVNVGGGPSWLPGDWHPGSVHGNVNVHFASQQAFDAWLSALYVTSGEHIGAPSNLKYYLNGERVVNMIAPSTYTTIRRSVYPKGLEVDVVCEGNVTKVENSSCRGVKNISFPNNTQVPSLTDYSSNLAFDTNILEQIRVPASLYDNWVKATNWSKWADYIVPIEEVSE